MNGTRSSGSASPEFRWPVLVVTRRPEELATAFDLADANVAGGEMLAQMPAADTAPTLAEAVLIDLRDLPEASVDPVIAGAWALADERGLPIIVLLGVGQIDAVAAFVLEPPHQLLCDPGIGDMVAALVNARSGPNRLGRVAADDSERLRLLNSEVARIAETLARLTDAEAERPRGAPTLRERPLGFGMAPIEDDAPVEARDVRNLIRARRMRDNHFAPDLFADPAWDMLLDLFAADLEHRRVSVSSLCIAAAVPGTTALRWIGTMVDVGLFERQADPFDRRRAYITLTDRARDAMRGYFASVRRAGLVAG